MSDSPQLKSQFLTLDMQAKAAKKAMPLDFAIAEMRRDSELRERFLAAARPTLALDLVEKLKTLQSTSDKVRALAAASVPRAEIARMLDIRYQHVRNVLVRDESKAAEAEASPAPTENEKPPAGGLLRGKLGPAGRIVIPAPVREVLGLEEGTEVVFTLEGDEVRIATMKTHLRRLQARVREMIPEGVSLVDELIADRRREQEDEDKK